MHDVGASPLLEADIAAKTRMRGDTSVKVIEDLRLTLDRHKVTCLLGPSGCGKTTTLRIIMGLDTSFKGRVAPPAAALRIGAVFQDPRLLPWRTIEENVRLAAPQIGREALGDLLTELGLADWRASLPNQLSLGMARRAALARALAVEPDLLVLDEAFVSLDERGAEMLRAIVFAAASRRRTTVIMVTHNVREALAYSDKILVMAPRPTRIRETIILDTPRDARSTGWVETERRKLERAADFLAAD